MVSILPIILAATLSLVYLISNRFASKTEKYHEYILSIGSGMLLAIIFAEVIPELIDVGTKFLTSQTIALSILAGFVGYHLIEKYTYKHAKTSKQIINDIGYLHIGGFFADNFLEGFILVLLFGLTTIQNFLIYILFVPLLLGDIAGLITLRHINDKFKLGKFGLVLLSLSILFGAIAGTLLNLEKQNFYIALSVVTGIFLYFITRDEIPRGRRGSPKAFLLGLFVVLILFLAIRGVM